MASNMAPVATGARLLSSQDVDAFVTALLKPTSEAASQFVDQCFERSISVETILMELFAPAARRLGVFWEEDRADFTDVTLAMCRLQDLLRAHSILSSHGFYAPAPASRSPTILLSAVGGDQHLFGLLVVAEFFRRDGWQVWLEPSATLPVLEDIVRQDAFDVIGFSASTTISENQLGAEIAALKAASLNQDVGVLVGGRGFDELEGIATRVGADIYAGDVTSGVQLARQLLANQAAD